MDLNVKLGATFHQAQDTEHSHDIRCNTPGCTKILGKPRRFFKGIKLMHKVCPDCIQKDSQILHKDHAPIVAEIKTAKEQNNMSTIVVLMLSHISTSQVQEQGCRALTDLSRGFDDNKVSIATAGGIAAIVNGMKAHRVHPGVQENGCLALSNLAANSDNQVSIAKAGGIVTIVSGMEVHRDHAGVQKYGCWALTSLAFNSINRVPIANAGGIAAIVSGMEVHRDHDGVQKYGCMALNNLSFNSRVALMIEAAGGVQVLKAASTYPRAEKALLNIRNAKNNTKGHRQGLV